MLTIWRLAPSATVELRRAMFSIAAPVSDVVADISLPTRRATCARRCSLMRVIMSATLSRVAL